MKKLTDLLKKFNQGKLKKLRDVKPALHDYGDDPIDYERKKQKAWSRECEKYRW